jgi:hypothetical protein
MTLAAQGRTSPLSKRTENPFMINLILFVLRVCFRDRSSCGPLDLGKEILSNGREDIDENYFLIEHGCTVPRTRWEVEHVACLNHPLLFADGKQHAAALNQRHLLMWVIVCGRDNVWGNTQATDHQVLANDHLPVNALLQLLHRNLRPVCVQRVSV